MTPQRRKVREVSGQNWVPVLVTDEGEVVKDSRNIVEWAKNNPASGAERPSAA
jgi:glutathione S-transferase